MLSKVGYLNSSGYLILSNFWAERAYFEAGRGKFSQNSETEPSAFGKKPPETATGFQLLTSQLKRICEQTPCQDRDAAFLSWENSFYCLIFMAWGGQDYSVLSVWRELRDPLWHLSAVSLVTIRVGTHCKFTVLMETWTPAVSVTFSGQLTFSAILFCSQEDL